MAGSYSDLDAGTKADLRDGEIERLERDAERMKALPLDVAFSLSFLDSVFDDEGAEMRGHWRSVREHILKAK